MQNKAVPYVLLSTVLFACMNVGVKMLPALPSFQIVLVRSLISLVLSLALLWRLGIYPFGRGNYVYLVARGLAGSAALLIYFYTLQRLPLATAVTIQYLSPIFTVLFAAYLLREKIRWQQAAFLLMSFLGIVCIRGFDTQISTGLILLGILGAALSGFAYNAVRKAGETEHALVVVFYLPLVTIPLVSPYALTHWVPPSNKEWFWLLMVGLVTQAAQYFLTKAYQLAKASHITPYTYLGILFAVSFGLWLFGEKYTITGYLGMALVMTGVVNNYLFVNRITNFRRLKAYLRHFAGA